MVLPMSNISLSVVIQFVSVVVTNVTRGSTNRIRLHLRPRPNVEPRDRPSITEASIPEAPRGLMALPHVRSR